MGAARGGHGLMRRWWWLAPSRCKKCRAGLLKNLRIKRRAVESAMGQKIVKFLLTKIQSFLQFAD
jgi:hypothetical protein